MFTIAVLASTRGADLQAIIDQIKAGQLDVNLSVVISNKKDCYALKRAKKQGFETIFINPKGKTRQHYDQEIIKILEARQVDLVVLVGYMRLLSNVFTDRYQNRLINVHPSLLPAFGGHGAMDAKVHEAVIKSGATVTGCTVHFVNAICDGGPIILQKKVAVEPNDTPASLKAKVQALEKRWYPKVIQWIKDGRVEVVDDTVMIVDH